MIWNVQEIEIGAVLQSIQDAAVGHTAVWVFCRRGRSRNMPVCLARMVGALMLALGRRRKTPRESRLDIRKPLRPRCMCAEGVYT